jgi:hypothetical protein
MKRVQLSDNSVDLGAFERGSGIWHGWYPDSDAQNCLLGIENLP